MIRTKQMEFKEVVAKRKSVREFKKDTIGKEVIADIIMEAGRALLGLMLRNGKYS